MNADETQALENKTFEETQGLYDKYIDAITPEGEHGGGYSMAASVLVIMHFIKVDEGKK